MNKVLTAPLPDLRTFRPEVPDGLFQIVNRMLVRDSAERYQSMREIAADLERGRPAEAVKVPRRPRPTPKPKPAKTTVVERQAAAPGLARLPVWALGIGGVIAVSVIGVIVMAVFNLCPPSGPWIAPPWCPGSQISWPFGSPVAPTAAATPTASFITEGALGSTLFQDDFDDTPSPRWDFRPSTWRLETIDGRTALRNAPGDTSWAAISESSWDDYAIQFDFKFLKPDSYNQYYLMVRTRISECPPTIQAVNNYVFFVSPDFAEAKKETCESGGQITVDRNDRDLAPDEWHTAQIILVGNRIQMLIDGQSYVDYTDSESPMLSGGFSVETENGVELAIDNFRVYEVIPGEAAAATPVPAYITEGELGEVLFEDDFEDGPSRRWWEVDPEWKVETVDGQTVFHGAAARTATLPISTRTGPTTRRKPISSSSSPPRGASITFNCSRAGAVALPA